VHSAGHRSERSPQRPGQLPQGLRLTLALALNSGAGSALLAIRAQGQSIQHHDGPWHQVLRQASRNVGAQERGIDALAPLGHYIAHQPLVAPWILPANHRGLRYRRMAGQDRLNLAGLNAEASDLELLVGPAKELQLPRRATGLFQ
jgi:hypothetical protein